MTTLTFDRWTGDHPRLYCIWQDELRLFPDTEAAQRWARRQGLRAVFPDTREPEGIAYQFLGLTGLEEA